MSGTYVPPSRRNAAKTMPLSADNFPTLSTREYVSSAASANSFAALADDWSRQEVEDKAEREVRNESEKHRKERAEAEKRSVVSLRREHSSNEARAYAANEVAPDAARATDDGWTVVEKKKKRRELTLEEQIEWKQNYEAEQAKQEVAASVWAPGDHRSDDWSHRDRRAL